MSQLTVLQPLVPGEAVYAPFFDPAIAPSLPARLEPVAPRPVQHLRLTSKPLIAFDLRTEFVRT